MTYKIGDVLLCQKHVGVAKYVGNLKGNDYEQLSSSNQLYIKRSDIWVGLQLAEQPNINKLSLMKPHRKHSKSLKAIPYQWSNAISFTDYFSANYGILIPYKYIHKKINSYQILSKLTQLFHSLKRTKKRNESLVRKIKKMQSERSKTNKTTKTKSLESIIYDKNGNSYHHHQKITHTTTHSYKSSINGHFEHEQEQEQDLDDSIDLKSMNSKKPNDNESDKAVDGVKDNFSDRNMSDLSLENDDNSANDENVIKEENEEDYNEDEINDINGSRLSHARRYSAPWDNKKLSQNEFGSDYEKMYGPYWKNSGSRTLLHAKYEHKDNMEEEEEYKQHHKHHKHGQQDSTELNMLPMIKEHPETNRMYKLYRVQQKKQNIREGHKRSMSMSIVNVPRYFFEIDYEFPDLPDL